MRTDAFDSPVYHPATMKLIDSAGEYLRLTEHYRKLTDEEILTLARQPSRLTDDALRVLRNEVSARRLELPPEEPSADERPAYVEPDPDSLYAEERELLTICYVWSLRDALQLQYILDVAGIPFYMGKEKATAVEQVTSNFGEGIPVAVMRVAVPWTRGPMESYQPSDEPPEVTQSLDEWREIPVTCPKCQSTDVVFERGSPEPGQRKDRNIAKFEWACAGCGYHWIDDGVVKEK